MRDKLLQTCRRLWAVIERGLVRLGVRELRVTIDPLDPVLHPDAALATVLRARGSPDGGATRWTVSGSHVARIASEQPAAHGDRHMNVLLQTFGEGTAQARVDYVLGARTISHVRDIEVRKTACGRIDWAPAGAAVQPTTWRPCMHGPDRGAYQRPQGASAPVAPANGLHHHGGECDFCKEKRIETVEHWISPDSPAAQDAVELHDEVRRYGDARHGALPWLVGIEVLHHPKKKRKQPKTGAMLGVLRGFDANGDPVRLRAVSGGGPYEQAGAAGHGYWSPGDPFADGNVPTASQGMRPDSDFKKLIEGKSPGTFGQCAAPALITHALALGLRIDSMAEIWYGEPVKGKENGVLQPSCEKCRWFLGGVLCDRGNNPRVAPQRPWIVPPHRGFE